MEELKKIFLAMGFSEVSTFVRNLAELKTIGRNHSVIRKKAPWKIEALNVGFLTEALSQEKPALLKTLETDIDVFELKDRELYWLCRKNRSDSKCSNVFLERKLGMKMTFRGMSTVERLIKTLKS